VKRNNSKERQNADKRKKEETATILRMFGEVSVFSGREAGKNGFGKKKRELKPLSKTCPSKQDEGLQQARKLVLVEKGLKKKKKGGGVGDLRGDNAGVTALQKKRSG